jgi:processing peptidase subunit beta
VYDRRPDEAQCCVAIAFRGASWTDPDSVPLMVMQTMLGEGGGWGVQRAGGGASRAGRERRRCRGVNCV